MTDEPAGRRSTEPASRISGTHDLDIPSGPRPVGLDPRQLDQLLELAIELPLADGVRAVARTAVDHLARMLPDLALGVCVVDRDHGEQVVETHLPESAPAMTGHDPSRLFPELPRERIFALGEALSGSTLHVAGTPERLGENAGPELELAARAARILASAIVRARAMEAAERSSGALRSLQSQVIQAEKLASLGQIVAGVVHELNNPLTSIITYSDYLRRSLTSQGASEEDLERSRRIGEAAERILKFSRDLVAYARPAGDIPGPVVLHEVIDKALVFCEHEFEESSVVVERLWPARSPLVRGIGGQLTQVFVNLFTNAAHAMNGRGGRLTIRVASEPAADQWQVEVADEGTGIEPEHLGSIFEPFFTTKPQGQGTGLGLSIVRDIVEAHGGGLDVTSCTGQGTTFTVRLPMAARPPSSRPPPAE